MHSSIKQRRKLPVLEYSWCYLIAKGVLKLHKMSTQ